jgi:hypothetical protein
VSKQREPDTGRWLWWVMFFPNALIGATLAGARGAFIGGLIGIGLMLVYVVADHVAFLRRKRKADEADAEAEAAHDAETMSP